MEWRITVIFAFFFWQKTSWKLLDNSEEEEDLKNPALSELNWIELCNPSTSFPLSPMPVDVQNTQVTCEFSESIEF